MNNIKILQFLQFKSNLEHLGYQINQKMQKMQEYDINVPEILKIEWRDRQIEYQRQNPFAQIIWAQLITPNQVNQFLCDQDIGSNDESQELIEGGQNTQKEERFGDRNDLIEEKFKIIQNAKKKRCWEMKDVYRVIESLIKSLIRAFMIFEVVRYIKRK
ncbi:hypothetical protein pb186bvf_000786 [Paramecium bursaria]